MPSLQQTYQKTSKFVHIAPNPKYLEQYVCIYIVSNRLFHQLEFNDDPIITSPISIPDN